MRTTGRRAAEVAMDKNASPKADRPPQTSPEAPFATFIQLDGRSTVPSQFRIPGAFTITRLQSPVGLPGPITKLSPVPALLVSISLKSLPSPCYQVWTADKLFAKSIVHPFRSNVIDFDSQPMCWAGSAFDYVHCSVPRKELDDIAEDLGFGQVSDYRLAVLEDDLVVAQITKSILPFLGRSDPSVLALNQFSLILGAHLLQRCGVIFVSFFLAAVLLVSVGIIGLLVDPFERRKRVSLSKKSRVSEPSPAAIGEHLLWRWNFVWFPPSLTVDAKSPSRVLSNGPAENTNSARYTMLVEGL